MNCTETREHLPDFLTGQLESRPHSEVAKHLAQCPACQRERDTLAQVCRLLDAPAAPEVAVDLSQVYREAAACQDRRARRWRRVAGVLAAAALILVVVGLSLRLEVSMENQQMVLRWGALPPPEVAPPAPTAPVGPVPIAPEDVQRLVALEDQLRLMSQIVHALASNADSAESRDRQRQRDIAQLRDYLEDLRKQTTQRWLAAREYAEVLFTAQLTTPRKGVTP